MSNKVNDWANGFTYAPAIAAPTAALATSVTGTGVDFLTFDGNVGCVVNIGTVASTSFTFQGSIQEAATLTGTYTNVLGSASGTFPALTSTTGAQIVQVLNFQRTQRFLRFIGTIGGTTPTMALDVQFLGQQKQE